MSGRLAHLVERYLDDRLTMEPTELEELARLLADDGRATRALSASLAVDELLSRSFAVHRARFANRIAAAVHGRGGTDRFVAGVARAARRQQGRRSRRRGAGVLAAVGALAAVLVVAWPGMRPASGPPPSAITPAATVVAAHGEVLIQRDGRSFAPAPGAALAAGDRLETAVAAGCTCDTAQGDRFALADGGVLTVPASVAGSWRLERGALRARAAPRRPGEALRIATPHATAVVLGTVLRLDVTDDRTRLSVAHGSVRLEDGDGWGTTVAAGSYAVAGGGRALEARRLDAPVPEPRVIAAGSTWMWAAAFLPDGGIVAGDMDGTLVLTAGDGAQRAWRAHSSMVWSLAVAPDASWVASAGGDGDDTVRLWDPGHGGEMATLRGHAGAVRSVAIHPGGRLAVTGGSDGTVRLWSVPDGAPRRACAGHRGFVECVATTADLAASGSIDGTVRLWRLPGGDAAGVLETGQGPIHAVAFAPGGRLLAIGGEDGSVVLWDLVAGRQRERIGTDLGWIYGVPISPDGRLLAIAGSSGLVALRSLEDGADIVRLTGHAKDVRCAVFDPAGARLATASWDGTVRIWDLTTVSDRIGAAFTLEDGP